MKAIVYLGATCLVSALLLTGCNSKQQTEVPEQVQEHIHKKSYACPMKCEGDKTYSEVGTCAVCKMDLEEGVTHHE